MATVRPRYALFCDEAGGPADAWRSLAVVSGPLVDLLGLEHDLRQGLALSGLNELKWSQLRKRQPGLRAAGLALELATAAANSGRVRFHLWAWETKRQPKSWFKLGEPARMQQVYAKLLPRTVRAWGHGRWLLMPDERTGVDWQGLRRSLAGPWRKSGARVGGLYPVDSKRSALVQCCDLLAGLVRHSLHDGYAFEGPGAAARHNRDGLLHLLLELSRKRSLGLKARPGLTGSNKKFTARRVVRWV